MSDDNQNQGPSEPPQVQPLNWGRLSQLISERKIDFALWVTRLLTMLFALGYIFPIFTNPTQAYYKTFMATAATSALRLHQRLPNFSFSKVFFQQMVLEDSFHYLFCALVFLYATPMTLAMLPCVIFALLHFAAFSLTILDALGRNSAWIARIFMSMIEYKTVTLLRLAAAAEILIMFFLVLYAIVGRHSLISPFLYFRFLSFRYASRRNHYTRTMFYELRIMMEKVSSSEKCPGFITIGINYMIRIASRLAPPFAPATN